MYLKFDEISSFSFPAVYIGSLTTWKYNMEIRQWRFKTGTYHGTVTILFNLLAPELFFNFSTPCI